MKRASQENQPPRNGDDRPGGRSSHSRSLLFNSARSGAAYSGVGSAYPHSGAGYVYLGTSNRASGALYQSATIPAGASSATVSFWLNVSSSESTSTIAYDKLYVEVRSATGALLTTLATYSNLNRGTAGSYSQKSFSVNLAPYAGQQLRLQFRVANDISLPTTFRVDDVSVK